jgi:hypothetical protein
MTQIDPEKRRKNIRLAWIVAGFAVLMFLSSIPFWKGLFDIAMRQ